MASAQQEGGLPHLQPHVVMPLKPDFGLWELATVSLPATFQPPTTAACGPRLHTTSNGELPSTTALPVTLNPWLLLLSPLHYV